MRLRERLARHDLAGRALIAADTTIGLDRLAHGGLRGIDVGGKNVLLATHDQWESACALLALDGHAARIVLCPPDVAALHLPEIARAAEIDCVVCDPARAGTLAALDLPLLAITSDALADAVPADAAATDTEWVLLTSGTTGVPKLVVHTLDGLTSAITASDVQTSAVWATFYDIRRYGGLQIFLRAMVGGCSLVLSQAEEPVARHLARLGAAGVTHLSGTPSHWRRVLMSDAARRMQPDYVRLSGEIADAAVLDGLAALYPQAGRAHAYASTEGGVAFAVDDGRDGVPASMFEDPRAGAELRIVDGALQIRSPGTARRYLGAGVAPLRDADGFVDTGDMLERRGDRFYFVGRRGGIINVGGQKVHPEEVEAVINGVPGVRMTLVKARKNPITGAIVVADVVARDHAVMEAGTAATRLRDDILAQCRAVLPTHKVPARLTFVAALDVLPTGKLARHHA